MQRHKLNDNIHILRLKKKKQVIQDIKKEVLPDVLTFKIKKEEDTIFQNKIGQRNEKNDQRSTK